ncbi:MAG TPA: Flp pilus assembly protein CpaB [Candidimonas sp.]|nr:Flp pilus assembly protein CpaB [Candidimonas sp.]
MRMPTLNRSIAMLLLALLAGLAAAWAAKQHIQGRVQLLEAQARVPMVERVVAAYDLAAGTRLGPEHLAIRSFPATAISSDSVPPARFGELGGTVVRSALRAGDPVLPVHTAAPPQTAFSTQLANGRRAITMPVDALNSASGLLQPGDLIDLYVSFEYQRRRVTAPLLQGVLVLATGTNTQYAGEQDERSQRMYATVTLDVAPEDAVKLVAARQSGTITAVLRHPHDSESTQKAVRGDLASLLGVNQPKPTDAVKKITVIYGNKAVRSVPGLAARNAVAPHASGLFDLPYAQELASAWMRQQREQQEALPYFDVASSASSTPVLTED